jgi:aspartokinase-like uncharacterized kinase
MSSLPVRVVKVGCSLFERPDLRGQLLAWLAEQPPAVHLFLAGAGELADSIKNWDVRFQIGEEESHWLCIRALRVTARVLQHVFGSPLLDDWRTVPGWIAEARAAGQTRGAVLDVWPFLRHIEPTLPPEPLPHTWQVTTDSIAARVAEALNADELILLKSRAANTEEESFAELAELGFVDDYFPVIAPRIKRVTLARLEPRRLD